MIDFQVNSAFFTLFFLDIYIKKYAVWKFFREYLGFKGWKRKALFPFKESYFSSNHTNYQPSSLHNVKLETWFISIFKLLFQYRFCNFPARSCNLFNFKRDYIRLTFWNCYFLLILNSVIGLSGNSEQGNILEIIKPLIQFGYL